MTAYIIKVILCSAMFILTYKLLLEKEKMFFFNRIYLLGCLLLSFVIPALTFNAATSLLPASENGLFNINYWGDNGMLQLLSPTKGINYSLEILLIIYVTITTLLFFRLVKNLNKILSKARVHQTIPYKNASIILINEDLTPHSFFKYLFINTSEYKNGNIENEILLHEYAHIRQKHSYDILLIEILQTVFWFNPFLFFYRKAIQLNHEFLADEAVVNTLNNISGYQSLLIDKANKSQTYNLTSQFNYSVVKKRLLMLTKTKSSGKSLCRQIAVVPVLAVSIFLFSTYQSAKDIVTVTETRNNTEPSTISIDKP